MKSILRSCLIKQVSCEIFNILLKIFFYFLKYVYPRTGYFLTVKNLCNKQKGITLKLTEFCSHHGRTTFKPELKN